MNNTAHKALTQVINSLVADNVCENTVQSLRSMLELDSFQPVRGLIESKITEIDNNLKKISVAKSEEQEAEQLLERILESITKLPDIDDTPDYEYENENAVRH